MIKHIVMWRLAEEAAGASKEENARAMQARLMALPGEIDEIQQFEVGLDINRTERAGDVVLVSSFATRDDLAAYSGHPRHRAVVDFIRGFSIDARVVDYEV
ncbi:MAG: Dabb family protein [Candidatus Neomarinimicrobiota bacterium]